MVLFSQAGAGHVGKQRDQTQTSVPLPGKYAEEVPVPWVDSCPLHILFLYPTCSDFDNLHRMTPLSFPGLLRVVVF